MCLIRAERYQNAGVHMSIIKLVKFGKYEGVHHGIGLENSDPVLKQIYGIYKT